MRNQRTAHRFKVSIGMMLALFCAIGSFWLLELMNRSGAELQADRRLNEPDHIIERFSLVRMTKDGKPSYIISGDKLTHRPVDDSSEIDKPVVRSLSGENAPMDIHAARARIDDDNSRVVLSGDVRIDRAASATAQEFRLRTPELTIYPDEDRMQTDKPVSITSGAATMSGIGMAVNNATSQVEVKQRLRITYPPHPR
ncbi:LPS export ABC transporter periplasmic protein LptC [Massilia endophytica]|uniref:LPS export ABC transporter periplasmic protein LptC n=1 Tax=Massilia endophytica TaxID=2899220 RepID=UPI001E4E7197|nr:LPS export ABC transporter periplasmic protein LptC [Massilia endophytica]UGQ46802.1 LPS export ABC transporter periplasmic protein LptC [Massilia endophytica]